MNLEGCYVGCSCPYSQSCTQSSHWLVVSPVKENSCQLAQHQTHFICGDVSSDSQVWNQGRSPNIFGSLAARCSTRHLPITNFTCQSLGAKHVVGLSKHFCRKLLLTEIECS